ncbi:unnamed protein product, partial [Mesorhabditis spiculigera]
MEEYFDEYDDPGIQSPPIRRDPTPSRPAKAAKSKRRPSSVVQCNLCDKIFVSERGLIQHYAVHSQQRPFVCEICDRGFRFLSNLLEHKSLHRPFIPHVCPICGKEARLKGNLKKHMETHLNTRAEVEQFWGPYRAKSTNHANIPDDALVVRYTQEALEAAKFAADTRNRKPFLSIDSWIEAIKKGEFFPAVELKIKFKIMEGKIGIRRLTVDELQVRSKAIPFERFDCAFCIAIFHSLAECADHVRRLHQDKLAENIPFCRMCCRQFRDMTHLANHERYHEFVRSMEKDCLLPTPPPLLRLTDQGLSYGDAPEMRATIEEVPLT